jgi:hypothetical protein
VNTSKRRYKKVGKGKKRKQAYARFSLALARSVLEPHLRQTFALQPFLALHFMHTFVLNSLTSAIGDLISFTP